MLRVATAAAFLTAGATAQRVSLDRVDLERFDADEAEGQAFGTGGVVQHVPGWLARPYVDYFHVPAFDSKGLTLHPEDAVAPSRGASTLACGMGWAKNEASESVCFTDIAGVKGWGWSNVIRAGDEFADIPVYIGASQCTGGHHRHSIAVKFDGSTVTVDLSNGGKHGLRAAHVYVGEAVLPTKRSGVYTNAPGDFTVFVNTNDDPVVTFEGLDAMKTYHFAVHANQCDLDDADEATPVPEVVNPNGGGSCSNTFYAVQYACAHAACTEGVSGNFAALLLADGWTRERAFGIQFTTDETAGFNHETAVLSLAVSEEYTTPPTDGPTNYVGVFAVGCDEGVTPELVVPKPGPTRVLCTAFCPPGSQGFQGVM